MRHMGPVLVNSATVTRNMRGNIFVHWSNMLAGFMPRTIAWCFSAGVVWFQAKVDTMRVSLVRFATSGLLAKLLLAPEGHCYQSCHVKRSTRRRNRSY